MLIKLVGFRDASNAAYAAVVYIVENSKFPNFVVSNTQVSRLKVKTIPRLELLSTLFLARLITNVSYSKI